MTRLRVHDAIERGARRGARGKQHAERAVARFQEQRVRQPDEQRVEVRRSSRAEEQARVLFALEPDAAGALDAVVAPRGA